MKAKQRTLAALLACLVLAGALFAALGWFNHREAEAESAAEQGSIVLSSLAANDLLRIRYTYAGETLTLESADGAWTLAEDTGYHLSQTMCNSMASVLCALNAKRSIEDAQALSEYGLDAPTVTVTVETAAESKTFSFGATNEVTGDVYVQAAGDSAVYTVDAARENAFTCTKADLFDTSAPAGLARAEITQIAYTFADEEEEFSVTLNALSKETESTSESTSENTSESTSDDATEYETVWSLADGEEAALDSDKIDAMLTALTASVSAQVTSTQNLEAYGMQNPLLTVRVTAGDEHKTLYYSVGVDGYYLMLDGDSSVYTVEQETVNAFCYTGPELVTGYTEQAEEGTAAQP